MGQAKARTGGVGTAVLHYRVLLFLLKYNRKASRHDREERQSDVAKCNRVRVERMLPFSTGILKV